MKIRISSILTRVIPVALGVTGLWLWMELRPVKHPAGVLVTSAPATLKAEPMPLPSREGAGDFLLNRIARVHAQGRVLALHRYRDEVASLAPIDIVLGWGQMSDSQVVEHIGIKQEARRHFLEWKKAPLFDLHKAMEETVNLHLIPGTPETALFIGNLKPGMLIDLRGALTEAVNGETRWPASLATTASEPLPSPAELPPTLSGSRLVFVTESYEIQGRSQQDLRARALRDHAAQDTADLKLWFEALQRRRKALNLGDAAAVREFNREAARYMGMAHPGRNAAAPASLKGATAPAGSTIPQPAAPAPVK